MNGETGVLMERERGEEVVLTDLDKEGEIG